MQFLGIITNKQRMRAPRSAYTWYADRIVTRKRKIRGTTPRT